MDIKREPDTAEKPPRISPAKKPRTKESSKTPTFDSVNESGEVVLVKVRLFDDEAIEAMDWSTSDGFVDENEL